VPALPAWAWGNFLVNELTIMVGYGELRRSRRSSTPRLPTAPIVVPCRHLQAEWRLCGLMIGSVPCPQRGRGCVSAPWQPGGSVRRQARRARWSQKRKGPIRLEELGDDRRPSPATLASSWSRLDELISGRPGRRPAPGAPSGRTPQR
jgi:hypothetical protein